MWNIRRTFPERILTATVVSEPDVRPIFQRRRKGGGDHFSFKVLHL